MNIWKWLLVACGLGWGVVAGAQPPELILHRDLQAVTTNGTSAYFGAHPFRLLGVILNEPNEMLDPTFQTNAVATKSLGGQFQIFIQAATSGDQGGTALWMGQNYEARGMIEEFYDEPSWASEMARVSGASSARAFRKGDLVEVVARTSVSYGGKRNINEAHRTLTNDNFEIHLVQPNVGLPKATPLRLEDLVNLDGTSIFDVTRTRGGERWQGERVRLDGLRLETTNGWGQTIWEQRACWSVDESGRRFLLRMPLRGLGLPPATSTYFSAVGILNQESGASTGTNSYELFVQEIQPVLEMGRSATGGVVLSFPDDFEGYVVEATDDLSSGAWVELDATPQKIIVLEDSLAPTSRIYRLKWKP